MFSRSIFLAMCNVDVLLSKNTTPEDCIDHHSLTLTTWIDKKIYWRIGIFHQQLLMFTVQ
jgi:hypothetical protein